MGDFSIRTQTFRLGLADYRALWLSPRAIAPAVGGCLLICIAASLSPGLPGLAGTRLVVAAITLAFGGVAFAANLLVLSLRHRRDALTTGERIMIFDAGAVRLIGSGFDVRQPWRNFARLYAGRRHLFLLTLTNRVYIIPKAALATDDAQRLVVRARAALGKTGTAPETLPPLSEGPDNREMWLTRPYRTTFNLIFPGLAWLVWPLALASIGVIGLTLVADARTGNRGLWHDGLGLAGSLATTALIALSIWPVLGQLIRLRPQFHGERTFCFTRDHIRSTAPAFDGRYDWDVVQSVTCVAGVLIFRLRGERFTVPASAFAGKAQAMAFYTQAVAFWRAAEARREFHP